jgi:hypothetical protein
MAAITDPRERMPEEMVEIGFMVAVTVPSRMKDEAERELQTCVSFGKPCITKLFEVPAPRPVQTISATL